MSQSRVQEEAAIRVQAMSTQAIRDIAADLAQLMESANIITDPSRGNYLDMYM